MLDRPLPRRVVFQTPVLDRAPTMSPSATADAATQGSDATSAGLLMALTGRGPLLPDANDLPARLLNLDELVLLQELAAAGMDATLAAGSAARGLVDDLRARGLLGVALGNANDDASPPDPDTMSVRDPRRDETFLLITPVILRLRAAGFEQLGRDGRALLRLTPVEVLAASELRTSSTAAEAWRRHAERAGAAHLEEAVFLRLLHRLLGTGLVQRLDSEQASGQRVLSRRDRDIRVSMLRERRLIEAVTSDLAAHDAREQARRARTRVRRPRVVPVHFQWRITPLALGMVVAYAKQYDGGRLDDLYEFYPAWLGDVVGVPAAGGPRAIYLFSHYVWSSAENLALSTRLKASDPSCITIHGGPNVPKYEHDLEGFFRSHPHVDIAVLGEGEATAAEALAALSDGLARGRLDLDVLEGVRGLAYRAGDRVVRTPDRPRIENLDELPSPYLTGLLDAFGTAGTQAAVIETNRGCPYGCTFCDWGSATTQRIRKFSLDRVFEEAEWCGRHGIETIGLADANFGIFERDVIFAEKVGEVRRRYGFPRHFGVTYAKNSTKHLKPIVKTFSDAGVIAYGLLSLQSMDPGTLSTIQRSNIKTEKYDELAQEFRRAGLPLFIELMMGLPGSTLGSFRDDLQQSIDREVIAKVYPTVVLVNSPMNEPSYRHAHGIEATPGSYVTSAATFTREEYGRMERLRGVFYLLEKFGVLRHVARYVRQETHLREMAFYERLWEDARAERQRWPMMAFTLEAVPDLMVPPGQWSLFLAEVGRYLVAVHGVADDDALATVLAVQNALLPARDRRFPDRIDLPHDYAAWHAAMIAAKDAGHRLDWPGVVPPLRQYPPGELVINDPYEVCVFGIGHTIESDSAGVWELESPVSRPVVPLHSAVQ
jgi:radical SAM superfamily enzyme YgiQ (UPF0313 family)